MQPDWRATGRAVLRAIFEFRHHRAEPPAWGGGGMDLEAVGSRLLAVACTATGHDLRAHAALTALGRQAGLSCRETAAAGDWLLDRDLLIAVDADGEHVRISEAGIVALEARDRAASAGTGAWPRA